MNQGPVVSAIIPVYNRERLVARAIDSALAQEGEPVEVIVVDDGSTDGTAEVLRGYGERIQAVHQVNAGRSAARNAGLERARGEWVAFLDSDDAWDPQKVARQLRLHREDPALGLSGHGWRIQHGDGRIDEVTPRYDAAALRARPYESLMDDFALLPSVVMVRRDLALEVGGFDSSYNGAEDLDFALKVARQGPIATTPELLATLYQHEGQTCRRQLARENVRVLSRHLQELELTPELRQKLQRKIARYTLSIAKRAESGDELRELLAAAAAIDPGVRLRSSYLRLRWRAAWRRG